MFDINRELEIINHNEGYSINRIVPDGSNLLVHVDYMGATNYDTFYVSAKTGVYNGHQASDNGVIRLRQKSEVTIQDRFFVITGRREWAKAEWVKIPTLVFDTGKDGNAKSKTLNVEAGDSPWRFAVKKEVEESAVLEFEQWGAERFATGEWNKLPWADEPWAASYPHHFAHFAMADPTKVAFWNDKADAQRERVTVMAPGRYLTAFWSDVLTPNEIRDWAVQCDPPGELEFYSDPEEIVKAYEEAGTGCMRYSDDQDCHDGIPWRGGMNPTRAYGAGDLAVALLRRNGVAAARALVWPEKKICGRIYGDIERMKAAIGSAGYQFDAEHHGGDTEGRGLLAGAKLLKLVPEEYPDNLIVPYVDYFYNVEIKDDHLELCMPGYGHIPRRTDGLLKHEPLVEDEDDSDYDYSCEACGLGMDDSESYHTEGGNTYCYPCYSARYASCHHCSEEIYLNGDNYTSDADGDWWCQGCADQRLTSCDYCEEYHLNGNIIPVVDARDTDNVRGDACLGCSQTDDTITTLPDGTTVCSDTTALCGECDERRSIDVEECTTCQVEETVT